MVLSFAIKEYIATGANTCESIASAVLALYLLLTASTVILLPITEYHNVNLARIAPFVYGISP